MSESGGEQAALEVVDMHKSFGNVEVIRGVSMSAQKAPRLPPFIFPKFRSDRQFSVFRRQA